MVKFFCLPNSTVLIPLFGFPLSVVTFCGLFHVRGKESCPRIEIRDRKMGGGKAVR